MVYFIGDLHRNWYKAKFVCKHYNTTKEDILIILGDTQLNYFLDQRDYTYKKKLNNLPITLLIIFGNHDCNPIHIKSYQTKIWNDGIVYYEKKFENILFAKDGELFSIYNKKFLVCGGAYSIDKQIRLNKGLPWWKDEQPNIELKNKIENKLEQNQWQVDYMITHTCPLKYLPQEAFNPFLNQNDIDKSTETWLDKIENKLKYKHWYCGHFHIDKNIDNISFIYNNPKSLTFT